MKYLVDTNILIFLCNSNSTKLETKFTKQHPSNFGISTITIGELIYGVRKSQQKKKNLEAIIKILSPFESLDFETKDAWEYGDIRAHLEFEGNIIGGNDIMIAAQARQRGLVLITNNLKEFKRVPHLKIEDWTK